MPDFGPFSVDPAQVAALGGANFGQFVGKLLDAETAAHGMVGSALETTYLENVGDGGVDASLRNAQETRWIPGGQSAWQFKAGNLSAAAAKSELLGATEAIRILQAGGAYRLVLGASLTSQKIEDRRSRLKEAVNELGIEGAEARVDVIAGDGLARWIEAYPALAVSPLLRASGVVGQTFHTWSNSIRHATTWVSSDDRDALIATLRSTVEGGDQLDVHLDGVSGLGKTRLVLEAMRGRAYESLVVYSPAADSFPVTLLTQLQNQGRAAVVVIDECDRKQHEIYAQALTTGTAIRLITIGEPGGNSTRTPMISLGDFGNEPMRELLRANKPTLPPEAERLVVEVASGNIDFALKLADVAIRRVATSAAAFVTDDDLRSSFVDDLPDGQLFLASCALALFSRFGLDGDPGREAALISEGLGIPEADLRAAAATLRQRGLLSQHGRFRAVGPFPVAVYLAAQGWQAMGERIVSELLPLLDADLTERLFRRATEVGGFDDGSPAISAVTAEDGPIASLEAIALGSNSALLVHFSVLAPEIVTSRLTKLLSAASDEDLSGATSIRRDLVWALEKLAWHTNTFAEAADNLLRLAVVEIEGYSNNASGTWVEFFGARLPGTAASPATRMAYLNKVASSPDSRVRQLAVRAAARALEMNESIMVSGEVQGGVLVEPRGHPSTWEELFEYRNKAIDTLGALAEDPDQSVAVGASEKLVGAIHGLLRTEQNRRHLAEVIADSSPEVVARARIEVDGLFNLFDRVGTEDERPEALRDLLSLLPRETPDERLRVLVSTRTWDRNLGEISTLLVEAARGAREDDPVGALGELLLDESPVPAAFAVGQALHQLGLDYQEFIQRFAKLAGTDKAEALIGFLRSAEIAGDRDAFDRFLGDVGLPPSLALMYSVRGTRTSVAAARVKALVPHVPVAEAARLLAAWMHDADQADAAELLREWVERIATQADYNAAIDFAAMQVFRKPDHLPDLDAVIADLISHRKAYPGLGQESYDWSTLVRRQIAERPDFVVDLLADLVEDDALHLHEGSQETGLLQDAIHLAGPDAWSGLMERLERGEWRLSLSARDWLGGCVPIEVAAQWVGESLERARVLASVTNPGGSVLSPTARYLVDNFGEDDKVQSYLVGQYVSGMWSGNESDRISRQIVEVSGWIAESGQSNAVRAWARRLVANLEERRRAVVQEEDESAW